jgi:hypothetical protein
MREADGLVGKDLDAKRRAALDAHANEFAALE